LYLSLPPLFDGRLPCFAKGRLRNQLSSPNEPARTSAVFNHVLDA
jgi:hypothetical protein